MQRFILSLIVAILPSIATAGEVCSPSLFIEAAQHPTGVFGNAVTIGLINNDAIPDIAVISNDELSILLGQGAAAFDPPMVTQLFNSTLSIATGDFDGDTILDLAIGEFGQVLILLGHGDGTFDPPEIYSTNGGFIGRTVAATLDANASLDLAMVDPSGGRVIVMLNNGNGTFGTPNSISVEGANDLTVGDFGGDGILDIATANRDEGTVSLLTGLGNGTFVAPVDFVAGPNLAGIAAGLFDGDTILDLVTSFPEFISVLLGNGDGTFQAALLYPTGLASGPVAAEDLNLDGFTDVILAATDSGPNGIAVFRGNGDGSFQAVEPYLNGDDTNGLAVADLDGDGLPDVVTNDREAQEVSVLLDLPDGALFAAPVSPMENGINTPHFVQSDFNEDGLTDFAWLQSFGSPDVFFAFGQPRGRFMEGTPFSLPDGQSIYGMAAGEFTGDGHADLILADFFTLWLVPGLGDSTFGPPVSFYAAFNQLGQPMAADFNADEKVDVIVPEGCCGPMNLLVFFSNGDGTFLGPIPTLLQEPVAMLLVSPLTVDSVPDLVAIGSQDLLLIPGNSDGTFGTPQTILALEGQPFAASGDLNGDGLVDLLVTQQRSNVTLLLGNGDGSFQPPVLIGLASTAGQLVVSDFDGDGPLDFAVQSSGVYVFRGLGNGHFQSPLRFAVDDGSLFLATGDYDANGQPDIASAGFGSITTLLNSRLGAIVRGASVIVGSPAVLQASASGFGALTYQWRKDGVPLADGGPISGSQTATLTIDPTAFTDAGSYDVVVTDSCTNVTSNAATLAVEFDDVPLSNPFHDDILTIAALGITGGCTDTGYCPANSVSRAEMAVFLLKAKYGADHVPPPPPPVPTFADVPASAFAAAWIEELASLGVTAGCGNGNYCPDAPVTRAEMAIFLLKTLLASGYVPPDPAGIFADVPLDHFAIAWIEDLYNRGVTAGCGTNPLLYCPDAAVPREQMATFLVRTFLGP